MRMKRRFSDVQPLKNKKANRESRPTYYRMYLCVMESNFAHTKNLEQKKFLVTNSLLGSFLQLSDLTACHQASDFLCKSIPCQKGEHFLNWNSVTPTFLLNFFEIQQVYTEPELNVGQTLRLYSWPTYIGKVKVAPIWPT